MSTNDQTKLRKIVDRLRVVLDELSELEKTREDPALKQAALSAAMALAWIDLVDSLPTNNGRLEVRTGAQEWERARPR